jgi:predicted dehydrogenase
MKVLMVGLGGIGQRHVRNLKEIMGTEVDIIAYRVRKQSNVLTDQLKIEEGAKLEDKYSITSFADFDEALDQNPDVVFVCNPSSLHLPIALKAAERGCSLFIEKPLSHNYEQVNDLIKIIEKKNLIAMVGYQLRFHPCLQHLHTLMQQNAIGRIVAVRIEVGEYLPGWHTYEDYRQMYAARSDLGGGVILSQIHEMDYIYWLFGFPENVYALGGHLSSLDIDVEDTASILMSCFIDGRHIPVHLHQDYIQRPPSRTCEVIGDEGKIIVDFHALTLNVYDKNGAQKEANFFKEFQRNQLFLDELKHLLECLQKKQTPLITVRDGAQSLRMALAARESIFSGQIVKME